MRDLLNLNLPNQRDVIAPVVDAGQLNAEGNSQLRLPPEILDGF